MEFLRSGRLVLLSSLVLILVCFIVYLRRAKKAIPPVRDLPPLQGMEEGVGRCVELGRPVHFTPGYGRAEHGGGLGSANALSLLSGMTILENLAKLCAVRGAELIATFATPDLVPLANDLIKQAYQAAGKLEDFNSDNVRFISSRQFAYSTGVIGIFQREKVGFNCMAGAFSGEGLVIAEGANIAGCFQVAGATGQLPYFVTICDYTLIGEELFAAASYISKDPVQRGTLRGIDVARIGYIILTIVGVILEMVGINALTKLFRL